MTDEPDVADRAFETVRTGDLEGLRSILTSNPAVASARDTEGLSLILQAAYRDRMDMVRLLLAAGAPLDVFEAAAVGDHDRVEELLAGDPRLGDAWSVDGFTALHLAAFFGHAEAVRILLARGADPAAPSKNPMQVMPLHSAVAGGHAAAAETLLEGGAPVDARSHGGFTPLLEAAQHGDVKIVEMLLAAGADPTLAREDGKRPRELALEHEHTEVADLLGAAEGSRPSGRAALP